MAVGKMLISPDIEDRLGKNGVSEVAASLWPVDCQTCGQSLGSRPPSLCVDDLVGFVMATLHHGRCRASEWNHQEAVRTPAADVVTHRTRLVMPPLSDLGVVGSGLGVIPVMLVNPSMENVILVLDDGGTWHPQLHAVWVGMGMVPPGPGLRAYKPIAGAAARLTAAAVTITLRRPAPADAYECGLTEADGLFPSEIVSQGGIMLAVTYVADPSSEDEDLARQFRDALRGGRVLLGWIPLSRR